MLNRLRMTEVWYKSMLSIRVGIKCNFSTIILLTFVFELLAYNPFLAQYIIILYYIYTMYLGTVKYTTYYKLNWRPFFTMTSNIPVGGVNLACEDTKVIHYRITSKLRQLTVRYIINIIGSYFIAPLLWKKSPQGCFTINIHSKI